MLAFATIVDEDYPVSWREFLDRFGTEGSCLGYLHRLRWPRGFVCPDCAAAAAPYVSSRSRLVCRACGFQTTVTAGTIFDKTRTPLRVWLAACWYVVNQKYGASALGLQRALGLGSYQTAWAMLHRLHKAMAHPPPGLLEGLVEVGETGLAVALRGAAPVPLKARIRPGPVVVALALEVSRPKGFGHLRLQRVADTSARDMASLVQRNVAPEATVRTANLEDYRALSDLGYECQYAAAQGTRQPALPGLYQVAVLLKRWVQRTHQGAIQPSLFDEHLQEFGFRFNLRSADSVGLLFSRLLQQAMHTAPLTYQNIVQHRP